MFHHELLKLDAVSTCMLAVRSASSSVLVLGAGLWRVLLGYRLFYFPCPEAVLALAQRGMGAAAARYALIVPEAAFGFLSRF